MIGKSPRENSDPVTISRGEFDAAIFDLDGVLTDTARIHATAWKIVLDTFLQARAQQQDVPFQPFDIEADYLNYVDGRPRDDGTPNFLASRGISLPQGSEHDPEDRDTVHSLGERKTRLFRQALQQRIVPAAGADTLLKKTPKGRHQDGGRFVKQEHSRHSPCCPGLEGQFDVCIDALKAEALKLPGKPEPAVPLEIARRLDIQPSRAVLFEDALAGVESGKRGGFKCVVGIDHGKRREALRQRGADVVIESSREVHVQ